MSGSAISAGDMVGVAGALVRTTAFAALLVRAKCYLVTMGAYALCVAIAIPLAHGGIPQPQQLIACVLLGGRTTGMANVMVLFDDRMILSSEAGQLSSLDVVLGSLWVWIIFGECVGKPALFGGAIVILAVVWYLNGRSKTPATAVAR